MIDLGLFRDVLASEWTKLRSVRSTYWSILVAVVLGIGLGAAISAGSAHAYAQMSVQDQRTFDPTAVSTVGLFFAQLALGVVAILAITSEYATGLISTTTCAVPQRGYTFAAKAVLISVVNFVVSSATAFSAFFIGQSIFATKGLGVSISDPGVLRAVIGAGLYIAGLSLFAFGLGAIIRHTAGAITALAGVVFIVPIVSGLLPESLKHDLARYFPANAGGAITAVVQTSDSLHPWTGYLVFLAWCAVCLAAGWLLMLRRDV